MADKNNRWIVVDLDPDATGYGDGGKRADASLLACNSEVEADMLADRINDSYTRRVRDAGGYPGSAWVLDLNNPTSFSSLDGWYEVFAEEDADKAYELALKSGLSEEEAEIKADEVYSAWINPRKGNK